MIIALYLISFIYICWLLFIVTNWQTKPMKDGTVSLNKTKVSLVISVRNENDRISNLIFSLRELNYPKHLIDIIIVDDSSEDDTWQTLQNFKDITSLKNNGTGKKDAITTAVQCSRSELIISTDADCYMGKNWVTSLVNVYENTRAVMVCGPVQIIQNKPDKNFVKQFLFQLQALEFHSLILLTASYLNLRKPFTCNAANIAYQRQLFIDTNGYQSNQHIASGDDEFLMHQFKKHGLIKFVQHEDAIIRTEALTSFTSYVQQRIRWASKHKNYTQNYMKFALLIMALQQMSSIIAILLLLMGYKLIFLFFVSKIVAEYLYIKIIQDFYQVKTSLIYLILFQFIYPFISLWIAMKSNFSGYVWKGRMVAKV